MAPSHYLNQCWLIISEILWHSAKIDFIVSAQAAFLYDEFEIDNSLVPKRFQENGSMSYNGKVKGYREYSTHYNILCQSMDQLTDGLLDQLINTLMDVAWINQPN